MTDRIEQPQSGIAQLQQRNPFEIPELSAWYFTHGKDSPKLCRYLELLDYLRRSLLGAIQQTALQAAKNMILRLPYASPPNTNRPTHTRTNPDSATASRHDSFN